MHGSAGGIFAGLFLFLTGYVSKAVYLGIFAALAALCFTGAFLGRRLEKVYLENLQAMISIDDILKEEGIEADFYPEQRLETDILAHQGLFGYARADGNNLISGSYNGSPFRSSFLSFSKWLMRQESRAFNVSIRLILMPWITIRNWCGSAAGQMMTLRKIRS